MKKILSLLLALLLAASALVSCSEGGSLEPLQDGSALQIDGQNSDSQNDNEMSDEEEITSLLSRFQLYTRFTQYDSASLAVDFQNPDESRQYFKVIDVLSGRMQQKRDSCRQSGRRQQGAP